jgi:Cu/Ag efflux protein CusF
VNPKPEKDLAMRSVPLIAVTIIALSLAAASLAAAPGPAAAQAAMVDGQVQKIDQAAGKITLKHGPIKNLDMIP